MKHTLCALLCFTAICSSDITAQNELSIGFYGDAMINAIEPENRIAAAKVFEQMFKAEYADANNNNFVELENKYVSVLSPEDNKFQLVSWQVDAGEGQFEYRAFIFLENQNVIEFNHTNSLNKDIAYELMSAEDWYGALYYNLIPLDENKYMIFGFNGNGLHNNTKVADVLTISDNSIQLGDEVFEDKEDPGTFINRLVLSYSSDASVNLNYNPGLNMIVHDFLLARMGKQPGQGPTYFPDGTYEGYELKEQKWLYKEKIFDHQYGENNAPRPKPVLGEKRSIFGK